MESLLPLTRRPAGLSSSSTTNSYPDVTNPSLPPTSNQGLGPWATLPALFMGADPLATLSLQPKKTEIADVVLDTVLIRSLPVSRTSH